MPEDPEVEIIDLNEPEPYNIPWRRFAFIGGFAFLCFLVFHNGVPLYIDSLWFRETGYTGVFTRQIIAKSILFFSMGGACFALLYGNAFLARKMASDKINKEWLQRFGANWGDGFQTALGRILFVACLFASLWAGRLAANEWANLLAFQNATPFHVSDPLFHKDVSFYVFQVPFLEYVNSFLLGVLVVSTIIVVAVHSLTRALESLAGLPNIEPRILKHLLALGASLAVVQAFATRLNSYDLLAKDNGIFHGAGYVDVHYRLFAYNVQAGILVLTAIFCLFAIAQPKRMKLVFGGALCWVVAWLVLGEALPGAMQKWSVEPNQLAMEQDYLKQNISYTRKGFGLENVKVVNDFPADNTLTGMTLRNQKATLSNIRLWDYNYLAKVYAQNQTVKTYYKFEQNSINSERPNNIDIDRYKIGGQTRQVMLAAREMDVSNLPRAAQTWQNTRLGYTHGYGVVMSPVNKAVDGLPDYFLQGIPPKATPQNEPNLKLNRPEIYYGLLNNEYVCVNTTQQEFDYPSTDGTGTQDHYATYQGKGGIDIGASGLAKLAFSAFLGDVNILLAKTFKSDTRLLFRRDIRERIHLIAPWVQMDGDPYLVISEGRLTWMIDCYTVSDRYPYATPVNVPVTAYSDIAPNYIRNSVKATVDAYEGTVSLYLSDPEDPIAQTYNKSFGGVLKPLSEMPADLREHLRYPEDLFRLQRSVYATYHVDDPRVFYLKEDAWGIPSEPNADSSPAQNGEAPRAAARQMEPYYVVMRLPDEKDEEFLLMSPMAPINREDKNMLGWLCARCDAPNYGRLELYRFSQQSSVNGPSQVIALINSDPIISSQLSLLRQGGSNAIFGNLLTLPIDKSILYIAPLYIEASNSAKLPQLQKVVAIFGQRAVMENTLEEALTRLFPGYGENAPNANAPVSSSPPLKTNGPPIAVPAELKSLIERAGGQYDAAQQKLKAGDFAGYGATLKDLEKTIQELRRMSGGVPPKKP